MSTNATICPGRPDSINISVMKQQLKQALSQREKKRIVKPDHILAAVLVPLYYKDGQIHILFTKRTDTVKTHKGHVCFPGGGYEESDNTLLNTALRESNEEIGLSPEDIEIIGELDDIASLTTNYIISPFVSFIPWPYEFTLSSYEAERLIEVPIQVLLDRNCVNKGTELWGGELVTAYFYQYRGDIIWGATARILSQFLDIYVQASKDSQVKDL